MRNFYFLFFFNFKHFLCRAVEQELSDANEQLSEAVVSNQAISAAKRKMEQEMSTLQVL